jgi:peptidoglycan/LPS O-acetylase OafA/YrhL
MTAPQETTADLLRDLSQQITTLVRQELVLAKNEMVVKGRRARFGAGLLGAAGLLGVLGLATVVAAAVAGLSMVLPVWAAALIVAGVLGLMAGGAALFGKRELADAGPPVPAGAVASTKEDVEWLKSQTKSARP